MPMILRAPVAALIAAGAIGLYPPGLCEAVAGDDQNRMQVQYLSGTGSDDRVEWQFRCTKGRRCGEWTTIPVPSCWETEGFGAFNYGRDLRKDGLHYDRAAESGHYRHAFTVPETWRGRRVDVVFDGVFTDAEVRINGSLAGPIHQGGFYRFRYDISALLTYGALNQIEVAVDKMSADASVNEAERAGDYWIFGGIYRPVYLESRPAEHVRHVAIAAHADGSFRLSASLRNVAHADRLRVTIQDAQGAAVAEPIETALSHGQTSATVATRLAGAQTWSAETPSLYRAQVELMNGASRLHVQTERFGFRTVEVRRGEGIFVNGKRVMFKGTNRHAFWPDTGRTVNRSIDELDVELMKDMNMNAVRTSHYPPDASFLDVCDERGLYALVELAGWHWAYSDEIGAKLVREMVERDANHPSVLFWLNGNEGGTNMNLEAAFTANDPQGRPVLVPGEQRTWIHNGVITKHYPKYYELEEALTRPEALLARRYAKEGKLDELRAMNLPEGGHGAIVMPTEMLHGLYDGGNGSGLADFWDLMRRHPTSAGGFTWAFADEAIRRPDRFGAVDPHMTDAPDGIVGPHRQKEGSFYAIKEIWSPVVIAMETLPGDFDGAIEVENRYDTTDLDRVRFEWSLLDWTGPSDRSAEEHVVARGESAGPPAPPGQTATLRLNLPSDWRTHHGLSLRAIDWTGREILTWTWPIRSSKEWAESVVRTSGGSTVRYALERLDMEGEALHVLECDRLLIGIDPRTGRLAQVRHAREGRGKVRRIAFDNGPAMAGGTDGAVLAVTHRAEAEAHVVEVTYGGDLRSVTWKLFPSGWIELAYRYHKVGRVDFLGVSFDLPERDVYGVRWLGNGPFRVWKNRLAGARFGLWEKGHNRSMTGHAPWEYPEFRGYHEGVFWAMLETTQGRINVVDPRGDMFLRLYTPDYLPGEMVQAPFPSGGISFLDAIPPIGQKFDPAYWPEGELTQRHGEGGVAPFDGVFGPQSAKPKATGENSRTLYLFFGVQ